MERDKGIEPSPRPWQGRVLPLYESRSDNRIYSMSGGDQQGAGIQGAAKLLLAARDATRRARLAAPWSPPWAADATCVGSRISRLRERASTSRWETAVAGRRNAVRARDRCTRARISRRRDNKRSLASGDVCDACRHSNPSLLFSRDLPQDFGCHTIAVSADGRKQ